MNEVAELLDYYGRTPDAVASAVRKEFALICDEDVPTVARYILETVPATTALSVSHIVEAKRAVGAKTKRTQQVQAFRVECPVCETEFIWAQGSSDRCPNCEYPYYETYVASLYREIGKNHLDSWEEKMISLYRDMLRKKQGRGE